MSWDMFERIFMHWGGDTSSDSTPLSAQTGQGTTHFIAVTEPDLSDPRLRSTGTLSTWYSLRFIQPVVVAEECSDRLQVSGSNSFSFSSGKVGL